MRDSVLDRLYRRTPGIGTRSRVYTDVHAERIRAHMKHGHGPDGTGPLQGMEIKTPYSSDWWPVVIEELGEVGRAINDGDNLEHFRAELVQTAAMLCAWIDSCDRWANSSTNFDSLNDLFAADR